MFFKSEHPFEEFFCYCVVLLNKTWRDMRATKEDFNKVFDVVVEQIWDDGPGQAAAANLT